eukprot:TRINITY_DN1253_c1_g1_i1.p1 TRINITY_DN1253_c1_g1~~TRINITY_DN1253_c1_g1_i1.p1  ORF type:complete len:780 (+),score=119.73 TRINITY_DN1253_c1_g1_i1:45-2384(+)
MQSGRWFEWGMMRVRAQFGAPGDSRNVLLRKLVATLCCIVTDVFTLFVIVSNIASNKWGGYELQYVCNAVVFVVQTCMLAHMRITRSCSDTAFMVWLTAGLAGVVVGDLYQASTNKARMAPIFVVLLDIALVGRLPRATCGRLACMMVGWFVIIELEIIYRWGLLDVWGTATYERRVQQWCTCNNPPCGTSNIGDSDGLRLWLFVFFFDFFVTRWFASTADAQHARVAATVLASQEIAAALADFDLADAERALANAALTPELDDAFSTLLRNLASYRPYLPHEFFMATDDSDEALPGLSPSGAAGTAVVFTDIRQSTRLWQHSHDSMGAALNIHDAIIRSALESCQGYEVKTIGDAFMAAFAHSEGAVRFAIEAQTELGLAAWPDGLSRGQDGASDGHGVLEVRIGIHFGPVEVKQNPVSRRFDCFGTTVNTAARVEPAAAPGAVAVTDAVMEELPPALLEELDVIVVPYTGERVGKGLSEGLRLTGLLPRAMERKYSGFLSVCEGDTPVRDPLPARDEQSRSFASLMGMSHGEASLCDSQLSMNSVQSDYTTGTRAMHVPWLTLRQRSATVCCCNVFSGLTAPPTGSRAEPESAGHDVAQCASGRLHQIERGLAMTQGHLSNILGNVALLSWNVYKLVPAHGGAAAQFVVGLNSHGGKEWFVAGLVTGPASSGEMAASSMKRFINLWGPSVDLSGLLLGEAVRIPDTVAVAVDLGGGGADAFTAHGFKLQAAGDGSSPGFRRAVLARGRRSKRDVAVYSETSVTHSSMDLATAEFCHI